MNMLLKFLPLVLISQMSLLAQSKEECIAYITQELRSYENRFYFIEELSFSKEGDVFSFLRARGKDRFNRPARIRDKWLVLPLKNVEVFYTTHNPPKGITYYSLMARSRGRTGFFKSNGLDFQGERAIITRIESERQAKSLALAFERLTILTTGRKDPFVDK